jgi:hypothetical protein
MNFARLENLIVALRDAKPDDFDMGLYAHDCNTPSCVFGHYCARRDLQGEFALSPTGWPEQLVDGYGFSAHHETRAVREHFGITRDQAAELFGTWEEDDDEPQGCGAATTPAEAIAYIRSFIDRHREAERTEATP